MPKFQLYDEPERVVGVEVLVNNTATGPQAVSMLFVKEGAGRKMVDTVSDIESFKQLYLLLATNLITAETPGWVIEYVGMVAPFPIKTLLAYHLKSG